MLASMLAPKLAITWRTARWPQFRYRNNGGNGDMASPAFSLDIDDSAELATVRPREGARILVERVSPTEVVLRLRPSDGSPAAPLPTKPATSEPPAMAEAGAAVSQPPTTEPADAAAHRDAAVKAEDAAAQPDGAEGGRWQDLLQMFTGKQQCAGLCKACIHT